MDLEAKRHEWEGLLRKSGGTLDTHVFIANARREASAFHGDFVWDQKEAAQQYYEKRAANLIRHYSSVFNVRTAEQRLYPVPSGPPPTKKVYKSAKRIARSKRDMHAVTTWAWSRLRMVARDIEPFAAVVPAFAEIHSFLAEKLEEAKVL